MSPTTRGRLILGLGAVLAYPAVRTWLDGDLPMETAVVRVAVAVALAAGAVAVLAAVLRGYAPEPAPGAAGALPDGVEDAVLVDEPSERPTEP